MEVICDLNYNEELNERVPEINESVFNVDFLDIPGGWFEKYKAATAELLGRQDLHPFTRESIVIMTSETGKDFEAFYKEAIQSLGFLRQGIDVTLQHNDIQENNFMVRNTDKLSPLMIDFEYSAINLRGTDIASYCNEATINYTHKDFPYYKISYEWELPEDIKELAYVSYLERFYDCHLPTNLKWPNKEDFLKVELPILRKQVEVCRMLQDIQWAVWTVLMMP